MVNDGTSIKSIMRSVGYCEEMIYDKVKVTIRDEISIGLHVMLC